MKVCNLDVLIDGGDNFFYGRVHANTIVRPASLWAFFGPRDRPENARKVPAPILSILRKIAKRYSSQPLPGSTTYAVVPQQQTSRAT